MLFGSKTLTGVNIANHGKQERWGGGKGINLVEKRKNMGSDQNIDPRAHRYEALKGICNGQCLGTGTAIYQNWYRTSGHFVQNAIMPVSLSSENYYPSSNADSF